MRRDQGGAAAALINPVQDKAKNNYLNANLKGLREQAQKVREKKEEAAMPSAKPFRLKQFEGIESKVKENVAVPRDPSKPVVEFMRKGEGKMAQPVVAPREEPREPRAMQRPEVPKAVEVAPKPKPMERKFIAENRLLAEDAGMARRAPAQREDPVAERIKKNFGKVPTYLKNVKQDLEDKRVAEEMARQKEDIPPGYRMLPEDERKDMLEALEEKHKEAEDKLRKLPLKIESQRAKQQEKDLLNKVEELNKAISMFSKPKVLLQM
jgi:hypothetical protein